MEEEKRTRAPAFPPIAWRHGRSGSGQLRKYVVPLYVLTVTLLAGCVRVQEVEDGREHRLARDLRRERRRDQPGPAAFGSLSKLQTARSRLYGQLR